MIVTRPYSRFLAATAVAASAALLLTGCGGSSSKTVALGKSQIVEPRSSESKTDAKVELTVLSAEKATSDTMSEKMAAKYASGVVYYVRYKATKTEGTFDAKDTYAFSAYNWGAGAKGDDKIKTLNILGSTPDACKDFGEEQAQALSGGKAIEACAIFVADKPGVVLDTVVYGQPSISYKGRDKGWRWTVQD